MEDPQAPFGIEQRGLAKVQRGQHRQERCVVLARLGDYLRQRAREIGEVQEAADAGDERPATSLHEDERHLDLEREVAVVFFLLFDCIVNALSRKKRYSLSFPTYFRERVASQTLVLRVPFSLILLP